MGNDREPDPPRPHQLTAFLEGKWCGAEIWDATGPLAFRTCGGELRPARKKEGKCVVTYVVCLFCGDRTPVLEYDEEKRLYRSLMP